MALPQIPLQIFRLQPGLASYARQHSRTDLFAIVEREHDVRPTPAFQHPMRSALAFRGPAYPLKAASTRRSGKDGHGSCSNNQRAYFGDILAMFDSVTQRPQAECLDLSSRFLTRCAAGQHARQRRHLGNPPTVVLAFEVNFQHDRLQRIVFRQSLTARIGNVISIPSRGTGTASALMAAMTVSTLDHLGGIIVQECINRD